jgi:plasmid maintenance system antidote protein VapI
MGTSHMAVTIDPNLTQAELAVRAWTVDHLAESAGISDTTACNAVAGKPISPETAKKIAKAFENCDPDPALARLVRPYYRI